MSTAIPNPRNYTSGRDRYVNFGQDFFDLRYAETQKRMLRALHDHQRVLIMSGNGPGKSYGVSSAIGGFLFTNPDSIVLGTSGSYTQFVDTMWGPLENMHKKAKAKYGLPGKTLGGGQPQLRIDSEWFAKVVSPKDPGELEGRHSGSGVLVVIEEADKKYITRDHFDSAGSSITDANDRMIAVANPPKDETSVVYEKMQSDRWHVIQFSSFESHNVLVDAGVIDEDAIPGLVDLPTLADDWEAWNGVSWPGVKNAFDDGVYPGFAEVKVRFEKGEYTREQILEWLRPGFEIARDAHLDDQDMDIRWYRRRAGVIPPDTAERYRPFTVQHVLDAYSSDEPSEGRIPRGIGMDVARHGGDSNGVGIVVGDELRILGRWKGVDHNDNEARLREMRSTDWNGVRWAIDANGEGSGLADRVSLFHDHLVRFANDKNAVDESRFKNRWTEGLYYLGKFLQNGGTIYDERLREELLVAARHIEFEKKYYASRGREVDIATSKDVVKKHLGRSPDLLDTAIMAIWAAEADSLVQTRRLVW